MDFICSISFVDLIISVLFSFVFLGLSLVGLFISFCYCTIILIKWIFKQINADSIHISLFFCCCCCCCTRCCFICGAFGSGNCCYATRSNAQHAERELYGAAGNGLRARGRGVRWFQISATATETHVCNSNNNNNNNANGSGLGMRIRRLTAAFFNHAQIVHTPLLWRRSFVVF